MISLPWSPWGLVARNLSQATHRPFLHLSGILSHHQRVRLDACQHWRCPISMNDFHLSRLGVACRLFLVYPELPWIWRSHFDIRMLMVINEPFRYLEILEASILHKLQAVTDPIILSGLGSLNWKQEMADYPISKFRNCEVCVSCSNLDHHPHSWLRNRNDLLIFKQNVALLHTSLIRYNVSTAGIDVEVPPPQWLFIVCCHLCCRRPRHASLNHENLNEEKSFNMRSFSQLMCTPFPQYCY